MKSKFNAPKVFYDVIKRVGRGEQNVKVSPTAFMLIRAFHRRYPTYVRCGFVRINRPADKLEINYEMDKQRRNRKFKVFC
jgi:hypothetical protein